MRWRLALIIGCVLAGTSAIAIVAQGASSPVPDDSTTTEQAAAPGNLRDLTRILRSPDRAAELEDALAQLDAMIAAGNADAALLLGNEYTRDRGILPLDYAKAVSYLEQAVALGMPKANLILSELHRRETSGLPRAKTLDYLRAAADAGLDQALMPVAEALRKGTYGEPDIARAIPYYDAALAAGNIAAAKSLVAIYRAGTGGPDDGAMLARYLGVSADAGDIAARRALADLYFRGGAVPQDLALAEQHLRAALAAGDDSAGMTLATGLLRGQFGTDREAEAIDLLQSAFDAGNIAVAAPLADAYIRGRGIPADLPRALDILRRGADGGDAAARAALFDLYVRGSGRALAPDLAAAQGLYASFPESERTAAVAADGAILAAHGHGLDDFARMWALFEGLDPGLQARTGQQLLRVNPNAYVYMLQGLMSERGHYSAGMSGQLTTATIAGVNALCAALDVTEQCRFGPLTRTTWDAISRAN